MTHTDPNVGGSLLSNLQYRPKQLSFGTSGRRGDVVDLTQLEVYINALAELEYLQSLPPEEGGVCRGDVFYFAYDLRPSSSQFVEEGQERGEIAQAVERAIVDAGMKPVNLGKIPTPALTFYALGEGKGSMMITGSHIPFARNGYKTNTSRGELLKEQEAPINDQVARVRERLYDQPFGQSLFNEKGMFKAGHRDLQPETQAARRAYIERYLTFFAGQSLGGRRVLVYQHSAVGRDLLVEILSCCGAEVIPAGRSDTFVPIDTENMDEARVAIIQALVEDATGGAGTLDAVVSTDGDSDRPMLLGLESEKGSNRGQRVRFFGGDLVGMIVAEYLGADAVVVPITCNDAIDRGTLKDRVEPKTRVGSPFVVAGMEAAKRHGKRSVCGWEANGGFLTGSDIMRNGKVLSALPTRDAFLPILAALFAMTDQRVSLVELFERLPRRFSRAALLKQFPRSASRKILEHFSPPMNQIIEVQSDPEGATCLDSGAQVVPISAEMAVQLTDLRTELHLLFNTTLGFGRIIKLNWRDGVRICFDNGDVAHVRPSGNADELRIYAVADSQRRADEIASLGIAEPDGILRRMEAAVSR